MQDVFNPNAGAVAADGSFKVANISAGEARMELSGQWMSRPHDQRFLNLSDLYDYTKARHDSADTIRLRNHDLEFVAPEVRSMEDTHRLSIGLPNGKETLPTNWSFGQLASLAGAPSAYLRTLPSQIVADNLTWGMRQNRKVESVKAYYQPDGTTELHAITGPDYGRIPDFECVRALQQIAGNGTGDMRWKVPGVMDWRNMVYDPNVPVSKETTTLFASDRDIFVFLVDDLNPIEVGKLPDGSPDLMFRGFYITQSEMGSKALTLATMYLRAICCNRILWGVENFKTLSIRHSKYAPDRFIRTAVPALKSYAEGSAKSVEDGVKQAQDARIAADNDEALDFLKQRGIAKQRAKDILETVEREEQRPMRTVWDAVQGITAVARTIPHQDQRLDLERQAGALMDKVAKAA